jgi:hypothetical protein
VTTTSWSSAPTTTWSCAPPSGCPAGGTRSTVLLFGGLPIREPIAHYGPFVMNTREQIGQAIDDYQAGRLGVIPADQLTPRNYS